jgi:hypothetical protein
MTCALEEGGRRESANLMPDPRLQRQAGYQRYRADPRRARPTPINVIISAWRRGWSHNQIAFACGLSNQRINQLITRYEARHGPVPRAERPTSSQAVKFPWRCAHCNALEWSARVRLKHWERHFCSWSCSSAFQRGITDQQVEGAIFLRWQGSSWSHIAKVVGCPHQSIQTRIWKYLYVTGQLNRSVVESIWVGERPDHQCRVGWGWLERNTGLYCTEHGAVHGFCNRGKSPWGTQIASELVNEEQERAPAAGVATG